MTLILLLHIDSLYINFFKNQDNLNVYILSINFKNIKCMTIYISIGINSLENIFKLVFLFLVKLFLSSHLRGDRKKTIPSFHFLI